MKYFFLLISFLTLFNNFCCLAQTPLVKSYQKISNTEGDFKDVLDLDEEFGYAIATMGDINGDGNTDICVGAAKDDDGGLDRGAFWVMYLNTDGTVKSQQKISDLEGNFTGTLDNEDYFGRSITAIGDLNNDGFIDLCVGANKDDDGGSDRGAVWILFMKSDATVKSFQKISDTEGGFTGTLQDEDLFGTSVANIGDVNKDGITDIAVGANLDDDGGSNRGAVWILFLNTNGTVKSSQKISMSEGNFTGLLEDGDNFGVSVCGLGDLNLDEYNDIAVGAYDNVSAYTEGAVWILFLDGNGMVDSSQKIAQGQSGFSGTLDTQDYFGISLANMGDINGDDYVDIAVGALYDDDGGSNHGAIWLLYLNEEGNVKSSQKISSTEGDFSGTLDDEDYFGRSVAAIGDLNGDGSPDLCIGASSDDDLNSNSGAVWTVFLDNDGISSSINEVNQAFLVNLYPIPTQDYLYINFNKQNSVSDIKFYNSLGQQLSVSIQYTQTSAIADIKTLFPAIYSVLITSGNNQIMKEFIRF